MSRWRTVAALAGALIALPGLVRAAEDKAAPAPLVEIDGQALSDDDVLRPSALQVYQLEARVYAIRQKAVNDAIANFLLSREAKRRGITVNQLVAQEVDAKMVAPTADEVARAVAERIKTKPAQGEDLENLRESMQATMHAQRRAQQHERFVKSLRDQAKVVVRLPDEPVLQITVPTAGEPALGPESAPVTLVEFTDFQCPFCRTSQATLKSLRERFGDRLRIVHRDFPIDALHPAARHSAEAARCAGEQNAFWAYGDALYQMPLTGSDTDLTAVAKRLNLDTTKFGECLASKRHVTTVQRGVLDGKTLGVTSTPTFFINGRPLVGAIPLEAFQAVIERELTRRPATAERTSKP